MMEKTDSSAYAKAGVDVKLGDQCSAILYEASRQTWPNRAGRIGEISSAEDSFGGLRFARLSGTDILVQMNFDGIGTKVEVAERLNRHNTMAFDLFAMVCDDAAIRGLEPIHIGSVLDFRTVNADVVQALADGMVAAARAAGVAVINGELAELGERVGGYGPSAYNWAATVLAVGKRERLLDTGRVRAGQYLVAVREQGFRSNGFTLVRKAVMGYFGPRWHEQPWEGKTVGEYVLTPSTIYTPLLVSLFGGFDAEPKGSLIAAAHITGGGIPGKLGRCLKHSGCGALLDDLFEPVRMMLDLQKVGGISDRDAYQAWNMGQGLIIVTDDPDSVLDEASRLGFEAKQAGTVIATPEIQIVNKGAYKESEPRLAFPCS